MKADELPVFFFYRKHKDCGGSPDLYTRVVVEMSELRIAMDRVESTLCVNLEGLLDNVQ